MAVRIGDREKLVRARDGELAAERQRLARRKLDRRAGEDERAQRRHLVGRGRPGHAQRARRHVTDIAVAGELSPCPAVFDLVDRHALALERLGLQLRLIGGRRAHGRVGGADLVGLAFDEALRVDDAGEMLCREVAPRRRDARIQSTGSCLRRLRARRQRPSRGGAQQRNEVAAFHAIQRHRLRRAAAGAARGTRHGTSSSSRAAPPAHTACRSTPLRSSQPRPSAARRSR